MEPIVLGGIGDVVFDGLTAQPRLGAGELAIVPSGGIAGAAAPESTSIGLAPTGNGAWFVASAPAAGIWSVTLDGESTVRLAVVPAPATTAEVAPRFCRSDPRQTLRFPATFHRETGAPLEVSIGGTRVAATAEECTAAELPGVERCGAFVLEADTAALADTVVVALTEPCPGAETAVATIPGPIIVRFNPANIRPGRTVRARVDEAIGEVQEIAFRPTGTEEPFTVMPSTPLSSGANAERVEVQLPEDFPPGTYDVRIRDEACLAYATGLLVVDP
jgi:hypothetical protein